VRAQDRRRAGTGLGLAICRGFVEALGGWIIARNRRDRSGAVLMIRMPVVPEIAAKREPVMALTVLVVDDEPPSHRFLRTSLAASGYRIVEAEDAAGALRCATPSRRKASLRSLSRATSQSIWCAAMSAATATNCRRRNSTCCAIWSCMPVRS
jgi:NAD(P)-dependent dehydrogenase (short-subunit alcohol dehydrogenase family)